MISNEIDKWIKSDGKKFLRDLGLKKGQFVLDFGCGSGTYTILAGLVVGNKGKIFAVDKNKEALNELNLRIKKYDLNNVELIESADQIKLPLSNSYIDMVLLYDVLHLVKSRKNLLFELYRILKDHGILSVYPKHHQTYMNMNLDEVMEEIKSFGFCFDVKIFKTLIHDNQLERGYVLNFRKNLLESLD